MTVLRSANRAADVRVYEEVRRLILVVRRARIVHVGHLVERQTAIVMPAEAVQAGQEGSFVYVVKPDQTVEPRPVTVGLNVGGKVIVESGLAVGDTVVTDGQSRLYPGATIQAVSGGKTS